MVLGWMVPDDMGMLGYLKTPYKCNKKDTIYKIMIHKIHKKKEGVFVYLYTSLDAVQASFDNWYPDEASALEDWQSEIDERGWILMDDPMPYCQHDALLPIRVKGRNHNCPQWGELEIYSNGEWKEYIPRKEKNET